MIEDKHIEYVKAMPEQYITLLIEIGEEKLFIGAERDAAAVLLDLIRKVRHAGKGQVKITIASNDYTNEGDIDVRIVRKNAPVLEDFDPTYF